MIDIHSHLLPGVDDGSPSIEVSVAVLERLGRDGVQVLVCTPHLNASNAVEAPYDHYVEIFGRLQARAPEAPQLSLGWEIMLDVPGAELNAPHLALGGSRAVLVEFQRNGLPPRAAHELFRLRMSGIVPVVAHPERYWGCTVDIVRHWRSVGAAIQMDAQILLGNGPMTRLAKQMLEESLVDCLASDNHGDSRSLAPARRWLEELGAGEAAVLLTKTNAGRLLTNEEPLPVPPVQFDRGMLNRLRELVFGRR